MICPLCLKGFDFVLLHYDCVQHAWFDGDGVLNDWGSTETGGVNLIACPHCNGDVGTIIREQK